MLARTYRGNRSALRGFGTGCDNRVRRHRAGSGRPAILGTIREKVKSGDFEDVTDLSQGGLLDAFAVLAPHSEVVLSGDPYEALFSETYGRFLGIVKNETSLAGLDYRIIGKTGGKSLKITIGKNVVEIKDDEMRKALSSLTTIMRPPSP